MAEGGKSGSGRAPRAADAARARRTPRAALSPTPAALGPPLLCATLTMRTTSSSDSDAARDPRAPPPAAVLEAALDTAGRKLADVGEC